MCLVLTVGTRWFQIYLNSLGCININYIFMILVEKSWEWTQQLLEKWYLNLICVQSIEFYCSLITLIFLCKYPIIYRNFRNKVIKLFISVLWLFVESKLKIFSYMMNVFFHNREYFLYIFWRNEVENWFSKIANQLNNLNTKILLNFIQ